MAGEPMLETTDHLFRPPASTWADPAKAGGYAWGQMSHSLAWLCHVADLKFRTVYCMDGKSPTGVDYYDAAMGRGDQWRDRGAFGRVNRAETSRDAHRYPHLRHRRA